MMDFKKINFIKIKCAGGQTKETATGFQVWFNDNESCFVSNTDGANLLDEVLAWDGTIEPEFTVKEIKERKILQIKREAGNRILENYPQYKQNNILGAVALIHNKEMIAIKAGNEYTLTNEEKILVNKAKACNDYILSIREKSNQLETLVNSKTTLEELEEIDITDNSYWE